MKSIDKLRRTITEIDMRGRTDENGVITVYMSKGERRTLKSVADEIEAETERDYMRLPVDADGVPIHVGDKVEWLGGNGVYIVCGVGLLVSLRTHESNCFTISSRCLRIVKPRTLENIVADAIQYGHNGITGDRIEGKVAEFCAEIRELMGGDVE